MKIFQAENREQTRFDETTEYYRKRQVRTQQMAALVSSVIMLMVGLAWAGIVYLVTLEDVLGTITVGGFVSFMFAMLMLLAPARNLVQVNTRLQQSIAAGQQVFQLLDTPAEEDHGEHSKQDLQDSIVYDQISMRYRNADRDALRSVSLTIHRGETVALVGRSGSGKSSLANLLPRFYMPSSGEIRIDDIRINDLRLSDLRGLISYVGQNVVLFNDTVRNNITYGIDLDQEEELDLALRRAHVDEFVDRLPQGLETIIGEDGVQLSGGQRQRLALARALYKRAPILILDEATSSLDSESEHYVQEALDKIMEVSTTLIIAHRLSTVERADRIVVLEHGQIVEEGTHADLMQKNQVYGKALPTSIAGSRQRSRKQRSLARRVAGGGEHPAPSMDHALRRIHLVRRQSLGLGCLAAVELAVPVRRVLAQDLASLAEPAPCPAGPCGRQSATLTCRGNGKDPAGRLAGASIARFRYLGGGRVPGLSRRQSQPGRAKSPATTNPDDVGEEAVLIATQAGCPVYSQGPTEPLRPERFVSSTPSASSCRMTGCST